MTAWLRSSAISSHGSPLPRAHRGRQITVVLLALALSLRIIAALYLPPHMTWPDGERYDSVARALISGDGYGDAKDPPLHAIVLAVVYFLFGPSIRLARIVWAFIGTATCLVCYAIARQLFSERVGWLALGLTAAYPLTLYISVLPEYPQGLFTVLLTSAVLLAIRHAQVGSTWRAACLFGLVGGLAALTVPTALLFVGLVVLWTLLGSRWPWRLRAARVGLIIVSCSAIVLTWTVWHWSTTGYYFLISASAGRSFQKGNCDLMTKYGDADADDTLAASGTPPGADLAYDRHLATIKQARQIRDLRERDQFLFDTGRKCIEENPRQAVRLFAFKFFRYWAPYTQLVSDRIEGRSSLSLRNIVLTATYLPILVFSLIGLVALRQRWYQSMPLYLAIASQCVAYTLMHVSTRYRSPIDPLLVIIAAAAALRIVPGLDYLTPTRSFSPQTGESVAVTSRDLDL